MSEYLIKSDFSIGDEVCFLGDDAPSRNFAIVVGFTLEGNNMYIVVSYAGSEPRGYSENQLEHRSDRQTRELLQD